jgi:hypothetical protein
MIPDGCMVTGSGRPLHLSHAGYDRRHAAARVHTITGALSASGDDLGYSPRLTAAKSRIVSSVPPPIAFTRMSR